MRKGRLTGLQLPSLHVPISAFVPQDVNWTCVAQHQLIKVLLFAK